MAGHGVITRMQTFADTITELCRVGYPQSSPEIRQELISEQFVRGQSDRELKKYLWVVIRTQKDRKRQTLIEVCTDFASVSLSVKIHRPAEQAFAVEEDDDSGLLKTDGTSRGLERRNKEAGNRVEMSNPGDGEDLEGVCYGLRGCDRRRGGSVEPTPGRGYGAEPTRRGRPGSTGGHRFGSVRDKSEGTVSVGSPRMGLDRSGPRRVGRFRLLRSPVA